MRVAHLVPSVDIGGVEVAIERSFKELNKTIDYRVFFVRRHGRLMCNQRPVKALLTDIMSGRWKPDILVTSLWWAHPFGLIARTLGIRWIAFFHNSGYSHSIDRLVLNWTWRFCQQCIVDSSATAIAMQLATGTRRSAEVIPYVFPPNGDPARWEERDIDFLWVGRASPIKRLDLFAHFLHIASTHLRSKNVTIVVAGTIPPELRNLMLPEDWSVTVLQNTPNDAVLSLMRRTQYYFLFSDHEGMSMSTIEAVQSGCVAVVRPVGEIPNYLDDLSCISVKTVDTDGLKNVANTISNFTSHPALIAATRERSLASVRRLPNYISSLLIAVHRPQQP